MSSGLIICQFLKMKLIALIKNIDLNLDNKLNLKKYSHLITDWSGIYLEYLIVNKKKPILIETKKS